jgi:hypothetical protein
MRILLCLLLLSACNRTPIDHAALYNGPHSLPLVAIQPIEDQACTFVSPNVVHLLSSSIATSMQHKQSFALTNQRRLAHFLVKMQLVELQESENTPSELGMSVLVKVTDTRSHKVLLQEILSVSTLLDKPLQPGPALSMGNEDFRISPLGLAQAKLCRKLAACIEEAILPTPARTD